MACSRTILCGAFVILLSSICRGEETARQLPAWAMDASWYRVYVPSFHDGNASNNPEGTQPWTHSWATTESSTSPHAVYSDNAQPFGGDIQGLEARLPYLKQLGVTALYLSPIFQAPSAHKYDTADLRHIDDTLAVAGSLDKVRGENRDTASWKFSDSDKRFLKFVKAAHAEGLRVVLAATFSQVSNRSWPLQSVLREKQESPCADWFRIAEWKPGVRWQSDRGYGERLVPFRMDGDGFSTDVEKYLHDIANRWLDPDGDGDPSDGIDGFSVFDAPRMPEGTIIRWREKIKRMNPNAVLVGDFPGNFPTSEPVLSERSAFDLTIDYLPARGLLSFFKDTAASRDPMSLKQLLSAGRFKSESRSNANRIAAVSGYSEGRLLTAIVANSGATHSGADDRPTSDHAERAIDQWRLAVALQHLAYPRPMLFYGDEVGMPGLPGPGMRAPMWWHNASDSESNSPKYREDLVALIRQLHNLRDRFEPLKSGAFRAVNVTGVSNVLAFSRALPADEIIVLLNYGNATQEAEFSVGWPGQFVGVVQPELAPGPLHPLLQRKQISQEKKGDGGPPGLRLFGSRQYADEWGDVKVKIPPMSVKLVIVRDDEPR